MPNPGAVTGRMGRDLSPRRKFPQQSRAHATVARIKDAMLEVTLTEGYASASTNRVARQAGVTIASLYQYFPNKQAIAIAVFEDAALELAQKVNANMLRNMSEPLDQGLTDLLAMLVAYIDEHQKSLLHLPEEVPELQRLIPSIALETLAYNTGLTYLRQHLRVGDQQSLLCKLFFVQRIGMGMIRQYVLESPADIDRELFVAELTDTIMQYLRKAPANRERHRRLLAKVAAGSSSAPPSARKKRASPST